MRAEAYYNNFALFYCLAFGWCVSLLFPFFSLLSRLIGCDVHYYRVCVCVALAYWKPRSPFSRKSTRRSVVKKWIRAFGVSRLEFYHLYCVRVMWWKLIMFPNGVYVCLMSGQNYPFFCLSESQLVLLRNNFKYESFRQYIIDSEEIFVKELIRCCGLR